MLRMHAFTASLLARKSIQLRHQRQSLGLNERVFMVFFEDFPSVKSREELEISDVFLIISFSVHLRTWLIVNYQLSIFNSHVSQHQQSLRPHIAKQVNDTQSAHKSVAVAKHLVVRQLVVRAIERTTA